MALGALIKCESIVLVTTVFWAGCMGAAVDAGRGSPPPVDDLARADGLGPSLLRRLSRDEYRQTVVDLLGVDPSPFLDLIPPDPSNPFDNDASSQNASAAWIEGAKAVADRTVQTLVMAPEKVKAIVPCTPTGPADVACLRKFVLSVGSRALRRPLLTDEVDRYVAMSKVAIDEKNFLSAVEVLVRSWLQNQEFLYRVEIGTAVSGHLNVRRLTDYEMASRLSFLLWGSMPDADLMNRAALGKLATAAQIRETAQGMMASPRARGQVQRVHAMWLGYAQPSGGAGLGMRLRQESDALVAKVIFEDQASWLHLFSATSTYADQPLAKHYGLPDPGPGGPRWIPYAGAGDRRGLLSHGSVLANGAKFGDTSPVQRGLWVRRRLMCEEIPPPPPGLAVAVDQPPPGDAKSCKRDRYDEHAEPGCNGCHRNLDPIGFGLERFDSRGRFRTHEPGRPDCPIDGEGALGHGQAAQVFSGPRGLAERLIHSGRLEACFAENLMRFIRGRPSLPDDPISDRDMAQRFRGADHRVGTLMVELAASNAFRHRSLR